MPFPFSKKATQDPPLAWSQLSYQKVRLAIAISGISFANILIFMQLGFRATMFDGVTRIPDNMTGDLFLVNRTTQNIGNKSFSRQQLYRVGAVQGVKSAAPFYYTTAPWINPQTKQTTDITVIAFNPAQPVMTLPEINQQLSVITQPDTVLFDSKSLSSLGAIATPFKEGKQVNTLAAGREIEVGGIFTLGSSLFKRGHIVTSDTNYLRMFGQTGFDNIQAGVITLNPGADPQQVLDRIQRLLPNDVKVLTRQQFIDLEDRYWSSQPPGIIFNFGAIMGFVVGVVIVYQVLYNDVNDHLPEYATLKAIGYSDGRLLSIVFQEAAILAVLGFLPGFACSTGMYGLLGGLTRLAVVMRPDVAMQVFILTVVMCLLSAAIAVRKLRSADPADVF